MFELPDNWDELKTLSEILKNSFEALALIGGAFALWKWLAERNDRATDILLKLEQEFCQPKIVQGQQWAEDDERYVSIKHQLEQYAAESSADGPKAKRESSQENEKILANCQATDALLRFYVVLCGVRHAKQVPDVSLSTCYRFWLCHYYNPNRTEFKKYVDAYFPTLKQWLVEDAKDNHKFFRPIDFGWLKT